MSEHTVRAARAADESAILTLAQEEMEAHAAMDPRFRLREDTTSSYALYLRDRMQDIDSAVFVAELNEEIVGLAIGSIRKQSGFFEVQRHGYVSDLVVAPSVRRRGIGRALYDRIALWARGLGIHVVRLHVAIRSGPARAFWKRLGAEEYLAEVWIDLPKVLSPGESAPGPPSPAVRASAGASGAGDLAQPPPSNPAGRRPGSTDFPGDGLVGGPDGGF